MNDLLEFLDDSEDREIVEEELEADSEYEDNDSSEDQRIHTRKLHTSKQDKAIVDLYRMMKEYEITLSPSFQRQYVWSTQSASKFIESLLINIPIPTIFVSANEEGVWDVVDGQQRLTAIKKFYDNELELSGLDTLVELNKCTFRDLNDKMKKTLNNRTLSVVIIDNDSSEEIKFDIFMRINQGSAKLNEQELRNCIYRGSFMDAIKDMGNNELLLKILNKKENFIKRYQHLETIERFFSMREIIDPETFCLKDGKYRGRINSQINMFLKSRVNLDKKSIEEYKNLFEESIEKVFMVFGDEGFRQFIDGKYFYNINRSVAEMQLVVLSFIDKKDVDKNKREIRECFEELMMSDDKFVEAFKRATNNSKMVNYRYNVWGSAVKKVLK